jgi:hypothetical protein
MGTTCNCKFSYCQDVIAPLPQYSTCIVKRLAVHVAEEYEVECDGSFHERHHMLLLRCRAILSALHTMHHGGPL